MDIVRLNRGKSNCMC